jgi:hypothetical protein
MAIYLIPIFCFGLVITGIVILGIQQASDLAKQLAAQSHEMPPGSKDPSGTSRRGSAPVRPSATVCQL